MISEANVLINYAAYVWPLPGACTVRRPRAWHRGPRSHPVTAAAAAGELGTVTDDGAIVITHTPIIPRSWFETFFSIETNCIYGDSG